MDKPWKDLPAVVIGYDWHGPFPPLSDVHVKKSNMAHLIQVTID